MLRKRFSPDFQLHLEASRWWDSDLATLVTLKPMLLEPLDEQKAETFAAKCQALREGGHA